MNINDCYIKCKQKVEENLSNGGIKMDPARFIYLFNSQQNRYVLDALHRKNNEDIRKIQLLLVPSKALEYSDDTGISQSFKLASDYFGHSDLRGTFSANGCSVSDFGLWEVKNEDVQALFDDKDNEPSFDYRETFYTIGGDAVNVFYKDFDIVNIYHTYYRYPNQVDMTGYKHQNGTNGSNVDPEFDDKIVDEILDMVAKQFMLNDGDANSYSAQKDNVYSPK